MAGQRSAGQGRAGRAGQGRAGQGRAGRGRAGQGRAGQGRAGQGRAGQGRAGQGRAGQQAGQGRAGGRAGQGRAGQGRAGQGRAGQGRAGQGRAGQGRAGQRQGRAGQGRAGQGRAGQGRAGQGRAGQGRAGRAPAPDISLWTSADSTAMVAPILQSSAVVSVSEKTPLLKPGPSRQSRRSILLNPTECQPGCMAVDGQEPLPPLLLRCRGQAQVRQRRLRLHEVRDLEGVALGLRRELLVLRLGGAGGSQHQPGLALARGLAEGLENAGAEEKEHLLPGVRTGLVLPQLAALERRLHLRQAGHRERQIEVLMGNRSSEA